MQIKDIIKKVNTSKGTSGTEIILGLPGETIEYKDNKLYINDKEVKLNMEFHDTNDFIAETKDNEYFVLGDNREVSKDSRILGNFTKDKIIGKVNCN